MDKKQDNKRTSPYIKKQKKKNNQQMLLDIMIKCIHDSIFYFIFFRSTKY